MDLRLAYYAYIILVTLDVLFGVKRLVKILGPRLVLPLSLMLAVQGTQLFAFEGRRFVVLCFYLALLFWPDKSKDSGETSNVA